MAEIKKDTGSAAASPVSPEKDFLELIEGLDRELDEKPSNSQAQDFNLKENEKLLAAYQRQLSKEKNHQPQSLLEQIDERFNQLDKKVQKLIKLGINISLTVQLVGLLGGLGAYALNDTFRNFINQTTKIPVPSSAPLPSDYVPTHTLNRESDEHYLSATHTPSTPIIEFVPPTPTGEPPVEFVAHTISRSEVGGNIKAVDLSTAIFCIQSNGTPFMMEKTAEFGKAQSGILACVKQDQYGQIKYAMADGGDHPSTITLTTKEYGKETRVMNIEILTEYGQPRQDLIPGEFSLITDGSFDPKLKTVVDEYLKAMKEKRVIIKQAGRTSSTSEYGEALIVTD